VSTGKKLSRGFTACDWNLDIYVGRSTSEQNFHLNCERAACKTFRATWNLGANSAVDVGSRKTTEYYDRIGWSRDLPHAN
jgi:hypothetical protein